MSGNRAEPQATGASPFLGADHDGEVVGNIAFSEAKLDGKGKPETAVAPEPVLV